MAKKSTFDQKLATTLALRDQVKAEFLPLFDHCIELAKDSYRSYNAATFSGKGYLAQRAGRELKAARDLIAKHGAR